MNSWYDKSTVEREFKPGEVLLVFLPVSGQPLQARFQGPYIIDRKVSETDYVTLTLGISVKRKGYVMSIL
ncbi:hypothetical protein HOLleu_41162 [Holothuria leucospilota]|uniref:Uncharacterized protein n=1 Tax=Holothuria leucospilota TaxID=206669 RepID=A0A9Q0YBH8_HOLLE|nr:hypothetical protein HOLleu_41162 [Holothuria leucospilota]